MCTCTCIDLIVIFHIQGTAVGNIIGRAQRARTCELNADSVCMYVCMFICHQPTAVSAHASPRNAQT